MTDKKRMDDEKKIGKKIIGDEIAGEKKIGLTEFILTLHNEVQSAIDYIDEKSSVNPTELGKSSAIMCVERIRIKIPIDFEPEEKTYEIKPTEEMKRNTIIQNITKRKGLLIERDESKRFETYTKITKINVIHPIAINQKTEPIKEVEKSEKKEIVKSIGEIEIVFVPMGRRG